MTLATLAVRIYGAAARVIPFDREPFRSLFTAAYFTYKRYEDPFAALIGRQPHLFRHGHVLDIGANIGYTTLLFARVVDPPFLVHAVEPHPGCAEMLRKNSERSRFHERIRVHAAAAGAAAGTATLAMNRFHPADHRIMSHPNATDSVVVELMTADTLIGGEPVAFVKIDVQGFELEVSRGMTAILDVNRNVAVAVEYVPAALRDQGVDPRSLLDFYAARGFSFHFFEGGVLRGTSAAEIEGSVRDDDYANILCLRR